MLYLIDGHNVIAHIPDISLQDTHDEIHLVLRLRSWAAQDQRRQLVVYFDSGSPGGKAPQLSNSQVQVRFAPTGIIADQLIIRQINRAANPAEITVVSSDNAILDAARGRKMPFLTAKQFVETMGSDSRPQPLPQERDEPQVDEDEVAEWLALFGPVPERKPPPPPTPPPLQKSNPAAPEKRSPAKKQSTSPDDLKQGRAKLDDDELDEWLDLFGHG